MVVGELVEGLDGAAELGGDVVQGVVPGEVFLAEPGWVEVDHAGLLAGRPAGWLGCGDEGIADWAAGPGQRVPAQHLAQVAEGDAQVRRDLEGRGPIVQQGAVDGGWVGARGVGAGPGGRGDPLVGRLPVQGFAADSPSVEQAAGVAGQRGGQAGGNAEDEVVVAARRTGAEPVRRRGGGQGGAGEQLVEAPAPAEGQQAEAATEPDPAVTAEAAGHVAAISQAADEAGKALPAGDLDVALAAPETARDLAAQGRRAVKAAASGRRAPATRPGALRDLVEEHLRKFPGTAFTPHQVGKVLTRSAGAVANALDKLVSLGVAQMVTDKPRTYQLATATPDAPDAAGDPGTSAQATPSAA